MTSTTAPAQRAYVNLDYAASTPMRPEALRAQEAYDASDIAGANPNSLHSLGRKANVELERARRDVARSLGRSVRANEIVFTGGGTEANLLALLGIAQGVRRRDRTRTRIIVSAIEHDSMLDNLPRLHELGFETTVLKPNRTGIVEPHMLTDAIDTDVALVSIMIANNETGVVQPIDELARVAHGAGALMHTDAIQGYLHIPVDVERLGVDALSLAGHKVGAPVGVGALYLRARTPFSPLGFGGGQESGRRPGTQDLRAIVALAAVARELSGKVAADRERIRSLADRLYERLCSHPHIQATMGDWSSVDRLPGIVSIMVSGQESEELILKLDAAGFEVSAASACSSGSLDASHVLLAMGIPRDLALGSLRISFDDRVDPADLDTFARVLLDIVE